MAPVYVKIVGSEEEGPKCGKRNTLGKNGCGKGYSMVEKRYESDLTRKEKWELEREKLGKMTWKERIDHIWTYYKPHMAVLGCIILLCVIIGQMIYRSRFDTIFFAAIMNTGTSGEPGLMAEDFKAYLGDEDKYHEITVDTSLTFIGDEYQDYNSVMKLTTLVGANEIDAMLSTKEQYESYLQNDAFIPMDELLTEEQKEAYGDAVEEYAIRITDSEKLEEFGLTPGTETYLAVFIYTEHVDNAKSFIRYICEGGES